MKHSFMNNPSHQHYLPGRRREKLGFKVAHFTTDKTWYNISLMFWNCMVTLTPIIP